MAKVETPAAKKKSNVIGAWAFLIGVILALVVGLLGLGSGAGVWAVVLMLIGIIIGLLNVAGAEIKEFMLAGTVLVIVGSMGGQALMNFELSFLKIGAVFQALVALFVPATIIVALKAVFAAAKK